MFILLAYLIGFKICLFSGYFSWRGSRHLLENVPGAIKAIGWIAMIAVPPLGVATLLPSGWIFFTGAALSGAIFERVISTYVCLDS